MTGLVIRRVEKNTKTVSQTGLHGKNDRSSCHFDGGRCADRYNIFQIPVEIRLGSEIRPYGDCGQHRRMTPQVFIQELDLTLEPDFSEAALSKAM